ncbi:MAG: energy transducer TonB [Flavobacteriales bacterium]|nr:energy transducer TonB [Flavobacteriales bacterium]
MKQLTTLAIALFIFNTSFAQESQPKAEEGFSTKQESDGVTIYKDEKKEVAKEEPEFFTIVEEMPAYPGGDQALKEWIGKETAYPEEAKAEKIEGVVYVSYIVGTDGSVEAAKVVRGVNPALDTEALRVVNTLTGYAPGKQRGKAVRVQYILPIKFKL